jgi:choline dehydrogenase-like flavoprotein
MKYNVVIIGGGAAGSMLASRLAADAQTSVLLLEAGPDYPDPTALPDDIKFGHTRFAEAPDSKHNWALRGTITEEQGEIHVAQGKVIGGGSSINGQAMQRGFPEDFDAWAALGNAEWSYAKVLPYFRNRSMISTCRMIAMARTDPSPSGAGRPGPGRPSNRPSMPPVCRRGSAPRRIRMASTPLVLAWRPRTTWMACA